MKFYITENGFIVASGEDDSTAPDMPHAEEVAELLRCYPTPPEGYFYRLREDLTWIQAAEPEEDTETEKDPDEGMNQNDG